MIFHTFSGRKTGQTLNSISKWECDIFHSLERAIFFQLYDNLHAKFMLQSKNNECDTQCYSTRFLIREEGKNAESNPKIASIFHLCFEMYGFIKSFMPIN